jgi:LacI family transcriptional regulator
VAKKPTISDIAKRAGVSPATVSRVLNNFDYISEDKRQAVLDVMAELDYRPSFTARHMRTQRSKLIGFVTDEVATTPYAGDIIKGAEEAAWENGYILMVISAGEYQERARDAVAALLEREVEGIIYAAMYHRAVSLPDNIFDTPTVLANCFHDKRQMASVVPDEIQGGYDATCALLEAGYQRIAFINVNNLNPGIPASHGRLEGYKQALQQYGIAFNQELVRFGTGTPSDGYNYGMELLGLDNPPTAIFCGNDRTAMGTYDALRELGLRVCDDIAIVGFDNLEVIAAALHPSLSTMQLPHYEMGKWAVEYLLNSDANDMNEGQAVQHKISCPYIERQSL